MLDQFMIYSHNLFDNDDDKSFYYKQDLKVEDR